MRVLVKSSKLKLQKQFKNITCFTRIPPATLHPPTPCPILFIWSFIWEKIQTEMKSWLHFINAIHVTRCASTQQVIHRSRMKKGNSDAFLIRWFLKQIHTLCTLVYMLTHMSHPTANPNEYQQRGKKTQTVKLPIKQYDVARKVTGCTPCLLFWVIKKISFGHGHRCSGLVIFRPIFVTWTVSAGQRLASQPNIQLPSRPVENKWAAFTVGFKFARETQPDTKGQERKDILCSYRSFWHSSFSPLRNDPLMILRNEKCYQYATRAQPS